MSETHRLGELQLAIMRILWDRGEATVADVHAALHGERGLAPTTVATMLTKMERKGVVTHRVDGRRFVYRPAVRRQDVHDSMVQQLVDQLFEGDTTALVHHLLRRGDVDAGELDELRALIEEHEKGGRRGR